MGEVLREYLAVLGFKVDDQSYKKFNEALLRSAKEAAELGEVVVATATSVGYAVEKIARQYEALYYVSRRTGSTTTFLWANERAARQVGVNMDAARASVEGFAAAVRMNPGLAGLLRGMNINPNDAGKAQLQLVGRLKKQFGEGGYFAAAQFGSMFGMDEQTFRQYWMNFEKLNDEQGKYEKRLKDAGVDSEDNTQKFLKFSRAVNDLESSFAILATRIAVDFVDPATKMVVLLDQIIAKIAELDKQTGGTLGVAGAIGTSAAGTWLVKRLLAKFGIGSATTSAGRGIIGSAIGSSAMKFLGPVGAFLAMTDSAGESENSPGGGFKNRLRPLTAGDFVQGGSEGSIIDYFMSMGWTREQAAGIAANLSRESKFNHKAIGDGGAAYGVGQWHPDRQAAFKKWSGKDIKDSTLQEQLAFVHYELTQGGEQFAGKRLKGATSASEAGAIVSKNYERPKDVMGEALARGDLAKKFYDASLAPSPMQSATASAAISQQTTIHVNGSGDPKRAADLTVEAQKRVNGDLVRNLSGNWQ